MKRLLVIIVISFFYSCNSDYELREGKVYYVFYSTTQGGWNERLVENADYNTFSFYDSNKYIYGKDKNNIYFKEVVISGADPKTFKLIENGYAIDKKRAYYFKDSITNSSPKDFKVINGYYSKDFNDVYYTTSPMNVCSVENFDFVYKDNSEEASARWSTDGCFYYYENIKVPSNDYKNIKIYKGSTGISSDKKNVYFEGRNICYNKEGKRIIDTIFIETFKVFELQHCKDKYGCLNSVGRLNHRNCE